MELTINTAPQTYDSGVFPYEYESLTRLQTQGVEVFEYVVHSKGVAPSNTLIRGFLSQGKEMLYHRIITNLFRKNDFFELLLSLENGVITEEEYEKELSLNEDKYLIPYPKEKADFRQIAQIVDIVKSIGKEKEFSISDVSELFSLDLSDAASVISDPETKLELK